MLFNLDYNMDPTGSYKEAKTERLVEAMGYIPFWLKDKPKRWKLKDWFQRVYAHGGGWCPMDGWNLQDDGKLEYPEDPPIAPFAYFLVDDEVVYIYPHAWVCIKQKDGSFEVARMD